MVRQILGLLVAVTLGAPLSGQATTLAMTLARTLAMEQCGPSVPEPLAEAPWALTRLRPDLAWPLSRGAGVTVAVIDSGVSPEHPSLAGKVLPGADFVRAGGGSGQCDENGHGTLVAGIIAGREDVSAGFRFHGVAPAANLVSVRVLRDQQRSVENDLSDRIATAVRFVVDNRRAQVINLSLTTLPTTSLASAVQYALDKGAVVVAAAGNEGGESQPGQPVYPAAYPGVIGVAGVDQQDLHVQTSSNGTFVDVAAPGMRIAGPSPLGGGYLFSQEGGTSFAAAYVSGLAALIKGYTPSLTPAQVAERISTTADHAAGGWNADVGYGVINPARAVGALLATTGDRPAALDPAPAPAPVAPTDADRPVRVTALWIGVVGAALVIAILVGIPVVRRGRQRQWR